jgi:hypothetical protein
MVMEEWERYSMGTYSFVFCVVVDLFDASHTCSFDLLLMLMTIIAV